MDLANPFWSLLLSLIGIVIAIIIPILQRSRKGITYDFQGTELVNIKSKAKGKIQVLYDSKVVNDAYFLLLKFWNSGNVSILKEDFDDPISFSFGDKAEILDYEVIGTVPNNLQKKVITKIAGNKLILDPLLFNKGARVAIRLVLSNFDGTVDAEAIISGIERLHRINSDKLDKPNFIVIAMLLGQVLFITPFLLITGGISMLISLHNTHDFIFNVTMQGSCSLSSSIVALLSIRYHLNRKKSIENFM